MSNEFLQDSWASISVGSALEEYAVNPSWLHLYTKILLICDGLICITYLSLGYVGYICTTYILLGCAGYICLP